VDMTTGEVVSDDSGDMLFDLSTAWWDLQREGAPDLYPLNRRNSTDAWDAWICSQINVGHAHGLQQPRALRSSDPTQPERLSRARNQRASAGQKEIDGASPPGECSHRQRHPPVHHRPVLRVRRAPALPRRGPARRALSGRPRGRPPSGWPGPGGCR